MNVEAIPLELRERPQWIVWRIEQRRGKDTKVPFQTTGPKASTTDPATWTTFEDALATLEVHEAQGIGFVFSSEDPYVGIDLDGCANGDEFDPKAASIIEALSSYTERSVSGKGAHVIVRASLDGTPRRRNGKVEIYEDGRYFVVTGEHLQGTPTTIEDRQVELEDVLKHVFGKPTKAQPTSAPILLPPLDIDDEELLERARSARNGAAFDQLYAGETLGYNSNSEADFALCSLLAFWCGRPDPGRIDRLFRNSGLMREKWDERHGKQTYGELTITRALEGRSEFFDWSKASSKPSPTATKALFATPLTEITMRSIEWLEKPLWQSSAFELLAGAKGSGKGTYLASLAARISRSRQNVLFISSEDSAEIDLKPRLVAAGANLKRCFIIEQHVRLPDDVDALRALATEVGNVGLLVIDPVANHIGDRNSSAEGEVRESIAPLNGLADELCCLVVGIRHVKKDRSGGALASILGSTAWVDVPRAVVMVAVDDEDPLVRHIQVVAGNRSLSGSGQAFRIDAVSVEGLAEPITLAVPLGESTKSVEDLVGTKPDGKTRVAPELVQDVILAELEMGEKAREALDDACGKALAVTPNVVYKKGLAPLKEAHRIKARKDGMTGGWYWRLASLDL